MTMARMGEHCKGMRDGATRDLAARAAAHAIEPRCDLRHAGQACRLTSLKAALRCSTHLREGNTGMQSSRMSRSDGQTRTQRRGARRPEGATRGDPLLEALRAVR